MVHCQDSENIDRPGEGVLGKGDVRYTFFDLFWDREIFQGLDRVTSENMVDVRN